MKRKKAPAAHIADPGELLAKIESYRGKFASVKLTQGDLTIEAHFAPVEAKPPEKPPEDPRKEKPRKPLTVFDSLDMKPPVFDFVRPWEETDA